MDRETFKQIRAERIKTMNNFFEKLHKKQDQLLNNVKKNHPALKKRLDELNGMWTYEDLIYRFYHQSYKVYYIQSVTSNLFNDLKKLAPKGCKFNNWFEQIIQEGTGKKFNTKHNDTWLKKTRPMLEAFFHAKYFLEMAVKYGEELKKAPETLPSGWAGFLYLYNLR